MTKLAQSALTSCVQVDYAARGLVFVLPGGFATAAAVGARSRAIAPDAWNNRLIEGTSSCVSRLLVNGRADKRTTHA